MKHIIGSLLYLSAASAVLACDAKQEKPYDASVSTEAPQAAGPRGAFDIDVTGLKIVPLGFATDTGIASARFAAFKPGFAGVVTGVSTFARTRSGTLAGILKVAGKTAVASVTFGIDSTKPMTLLPDSVQFSATDSISFFLATTAAGTVKQGQVILYLKPRY